MAISSNMFGRTVLTEKDAEQMVKQMNQRYSKEDLQKMKISMEKARQTKQRMQEMLNKKG